MKKFLIEAFEGYEIKVEEKPSSILVRFAEEKHSWAYVRVYDSGGSTTMYRGLVDDSFVPSFQSEEAIARTFDFLDMYPRESPPELRTSSTRLEA